MTNPNPDPVTRERFRRDPATGEYIADPNGTYRRDPATGVYSGVVDGPPLAGTGYPGDPARRDPAAYPGDPARRDPAGTYRHDPATGEVVGPSTAPATPRYDPAAGTYASDPAYPHDPAGISAYVPPSEPRNPAFIRDPAHVPDYTAGATYRRDASGAYVADPAGTYTRDPSGAYIARRRGDRARNAALAMGNVVSHTDSFGKTRYGLVVDTANTHPDGKPAKSAAVQPNEANPDGVEPEAVRLVRVGWFGEVSDAIPESEVAAVSEGSTDTAAQGAERRGWVHG